jgi:DNA polymerase III gamma/tau subunit
MLALTQRPFSFDSICGQKTIIQEMKKRSLTKDFPSVLIFGGESGVGKSSLALIIAALLNDENPIPGNGCLNPNPESPESKAILNETFNMSCSMYDASRMAKEDVMRLEETVSSASMFGGKRVLIIDECFLSGTKVRMANGTIKAIEDIVLNDLVMGVDGSPRQVTKLHQGEDMMYAVTSHNRKYLSPYYVCNSKHKVVYENLGYRERGHLSFDCAENMVKKSNFYIPFNFIDFSRKEVSIDPYFLGLWLGDGLKRSPDIVTGIRDPEVREWLRGYAKEIDHVILERDRPSIIQMEFSQGHHGPSGSNLRKWFNSYGLMIRDGNDVFKDKYIPEDYLQNSRDIRLKLLAGIIDSDGQLTKFYNCYMYRIEMVRKDLMIQIHDLIMSLGFFPKWHESKRIIKGVLRSYYRVDFYGYNIPCILPRKQCKIDMIPLRVQKRIALKSVWGNVVEYGRDRYYGVSVDGDNLFLLANGAIVHNCQELSKSSKGITLKLLEKKRQDAYIILCTMNPDALDKSVRSRGLYYQFRSPSSFDIAGYLFGLTDQFGKDVPDSFIQDGLITIAENCEGSVRMAVQNLERCLAGELYTAEAIQNALGFMSNAKLFDMVSRILNQNIEVFKDIRTMDLKDFFYTSYKFISDCLIYLRTKTVDAIWKAEQYNQLENQQTRVIELFNLYSDIDQRMGAYFKPTYCLARLSDFFATQPKGLSVPVVGSSGHKVR